ncbi:tetratricopeptide repeat-containing hybrid sensor histidine kinase/response regulator [Flavobacterium columnare]|uniref:histidine kinase n=1 Tax=Flavobacterium columnare TaxID=996 RepID=A0AAI8GC22_9FLAO|nr:ATP-binding protein [Flavobacterium columnare]AMO21230.1 response regulator [Flavobacterium columnare]QOG58332.1 response regulator [Flavobacterium columnare]QOG61055.1 response regulator [Flavobacterium columnare]QOG63776.1 response regulator [Flavobacterium columnare]QOG66500.1 response regulator [Flavobacterium columnare]
MHRFFIIILSLIIVTNDASSQGVNTVKKTEIKIEKAKRALRELDTKKSMVLAQEGLSESFLLNDNTLKSKAYMVLGCNFTEFANTKKAKDYFFKSLYYANLVENDTLKNLVYNNLGAVYSYYENNFEKGIEYYKKGLVYAEKINKPIQTVYNSLNIAGAYVDENRYEEAIPFLRKAGHYMQYNQESEAQLNYNALWARYCSYKNQKEKAEHFFEKAIQYGVTEKENLLDSYLAEVYYDYAIHFEKFSEYKKALKYQRLSSLYKDKVYNQARSESVKNKEDAIKIKEYEGHISYIEKQKEEKELSLKKTYVIITLFMVIVVFLIVLVYILYKNNRNRRKSFMRLQRINSELEDAKDKAEESTRIKSQFVSTITHELRTPLYGVIGISDLLADEYPEIKNSKYLESLKFSAQYLLSLVNDVLQIYKITERKIILEKSNFNLRDKLEAIKNSFYMQSVKTMNAINIDIDHKIPERIIGDGLRLSQILMNLISNALKFTENGAVDIKVKLLKIVDDQLRLEFVVEDTGIGIAKENQQRIFEEFVQIERREEDYQGTGLGLPIVKKLVALFGGTIFLESEEGKGTKVVFQLNFEIDNQIFLPNLLLDKNDIGVLKILLAEDNKINQIVTEKIFKAFGCQVLIVENGLEAIEVCKKESFDIVFLDINMPIYDGYEAAIQIRTFNIITPIIALTAFDKFEVFSKCKSVGMNDVLVKPFEKEQLVVLLNQYVGLENVQSRD